MNLQLSLHKIGLTLACVSCTTLMINPLLAVTPDAANQKRTLHVKQVRLYDPNGFKKPILARTFLLPADWQVAGGVRWNTNFQSKGPAFYESFSAVSPDGHVSLEMLPNYEWIWFADPQLRQMMIQQGWGKQIAPPLDATGVVREYIIPNYRHGARIVSVQTRPDLSQSVRRYLENIGLRQLEASGCRLTLDFVEAKFAYVQNGVEYLESSVVQLFRTDYLGNGMTTFNASNLFLFKSPQANWNENQFIYATAMQSMRQNPAWLKAINQFQKKIAEINRNGAIKRQEIMSQMYEEMRESQQESWEYRQESIDHVAREFTEGIHEVETYHDPSTGYDVELPNTYDYAFSNGLGDYIVTNDPLYNPSHDLSNGNWHPLQTAR